MVPAMRKERIAGSTASEYAEVTASRTACDDIEVFAETSACEHECSVAAHQLKLSICKRVGNVEGKRVRHVGTGAVVNRCLTIVLASVFHRCNFPKSVRRAVEFGAAQNVLEICIANLNLAAIHQPLVKKACT